MLINMYVCEFCGRIFERPNSLNGHKGWCKQNPNAKNVSNFTGKNTSNTPYNELRDDLYCRYCAKQCKSQNALVNHERLCKDNPDRGVLYSANTGYIQFNNDCRNGVRHHPFFGQTSETCESIRKGIETRRKRMESGEIKPVFLNKKHSEVTKEKMRQSAFAYISQLKDVKSPRYNNKSIEFIDNLNKKYGWHLQHAENGGEVEICGYYVDGYDEEKNIVFEYDERQHYSDVHKNILKEKDTKRQNTIIEKLNCKFYRYNEVLDLFYVIE